ncbi:MAG: iron ABC transporter permease [Pyrinomonadaceae bacterium]|nr:iron ABC transporter permease [Pyrinomonadaceae bacterium]
MKVNRTRFFLYFIVAVVLLYGVIFPNFQLLFSASFNGFSQNLTTKSTLEAIVTSLAVSLLTVILSALVGVPLAFLFERYDFPLRRILASFVTLPLALPPLVGAVAFIFFYGESGILSRFLQNLFGFKQSLWTLKGWIPVLLFHAYTMFPFFYLLTVAGLRRVDESLSEASKSLGANNLKTLIRVTLPQLTPSFIAAGLITFMTSMASFTAPLLFGGSVNVLTLEIYKARNNGDSEAATVLTIILTAISLLSLIFFFRYEGTNNFSASGAKGVSRKREKVTSFAVTLIAFSLGLTFALVLLAPILTLIIVSFSVDNSWTTQILPPSYTFENYRKLFVDFDAREPLINSFLMAGTAAIFALVWSFCVVTVIRGKQNLSKRVVSFLNLIPYSLPGTALAIAILRTYGQPNFLTGNFVIVGTFWILPFAYFLRFMPLVTRSLQASEEQFDKTLETAAASLGANGFTRFRRVRLPLVLPGAIAGTLLAFTIGLGEYVASVLLYTPRNRPISIAIAEEMRGVNLGTAAAFGVILMLIITICLIAANRLER